MAQQIKLKRSAVAGRVPTTAQLPTGELAINTADGKLFFQRDDISIQSLFATNTFNTGSLTVFKSGSTVVDIQGSQGQLFSIVDSLSGSLMSVNDISGLPIMEVFSDDTVVMGEYGQNTLVVTGSKVGIGTDTPSARLHIEGLGTTSSTTSFVVKNSNGDDIIKATDDRDVEFAGGEIKLNKYVVGGTSVEITTGNHNNAVGIRAISATPISAKSSLGASGNNRYGASIFAERPTHSTNKNLGLLAQGAYISDTDAVSYVTSSMLHVRGNGTDSTTIGLLVENSNASASIVVLDDGNVGVGTTTPSQALTVEGSISASGAIYDNVGSPGTAGQMILSTGTGFEWAPNVADNAQDLIIQGKNKEATSIQKGTPLYFSGSETSGNLVGIYVADAGNPDRMPAGGVAAETIASDAEGDVYIYGFINGVDTSAFNAGDSVFVAVGGGYTNVKPTGSALIQKLGNVEKVHASNGSGVIQGPSWYNDLPNWEEGKVMVGRSDGQPVTSSFVHLDEAGALIQVTGSIDTTEDILVNDVIVGRGSGDSAFNTVVGNTALINNTTGTRNTAVGNLALRCNTSGFSNTAIGNYSMPNNSIGNRNTAVGTCTLCKNTEGTQNTAVGNLALRCNTLGSLNVAIGQYALVTNTTGGSNTAVGSNAMCSNSTGTLNAAFGRDVMRFNTAGGGNAAFGSLALCRNTTGGSNSALGYRALTNNTTGARNTAVGYRAADGNTTGRYNTALGAGALFANTTGTNHVAIGDRTMPAQDGGIQNTAVGVRALNKSTTSSNNTALGFKSLYKTTTGGKNVAVGVCALLCNITGEANTAVGYNTLKYNTSGKNVAIGRNAMFCNTEGSHNTAVGYNSLRSNTTGVNNTAIGGCALFRNTTGIRNVAIGTDSLYANTEGNCNVAVGFQALRANTTGDWNVAVGSAVLCSNTTGKHNIAIGRQTLQSNEYGDCNIGIGYQALICNTASNAIGIGALALRNNTTGINNVGVGAFSITANTTGVNNVALGAFTMCSNTEGDQNIAIGSCALAKNTTGSSNVAIGRRSMFYSTTGDSNTALGVSALFCNTTGAQNVALGLSALDKNTAGGQNVALGFRALCSNTTANSLTAIGTYALQSNTTGVNNTAVGRSALQYNTTGVNNTALGNFALRNNTANYNTAVGACALCTNTTGVNNTAVGDFALRCNVTGMQNTAVGRQALCANTSGFRNTALGFRAMRCNTAGVRNTALGYLTLYSNTTGTDNVGLGPSALQSNTTGIRNTAVGYGALLDNSTGQRNVGIGFQALQDTTTNNNVGVGYRALRVATGGGNTAIGTNTLYKVGTGISNVGVGQLAGRCIISGSYNVVLGSATADGFADEDNNIFISDGQGNVRIFATGSNGNVGIGTNTPSERLTVEGNISASGDLYIDGTTNIGGNLTVAGIVTAEEFHTEFVSASIIYRSGSTKFGDTDDDTHSFTGSLEVSGSITATNTGSFSHITGDKIYIDNTEDGHRIGKLIIDYQAGINPALRSAGGDYIRFNDSILLGGTDDNIKASTNHSGDLYFSHERSGDFGFRFTTADSGSALRIDGSGNVGISTTSPTAKLEIKGTGTVSTDTHFRVVEAAGTGNLFRVNQRETIARFLTGSDGILLPTNQAVYYGGSTVYTKRDSTLNAFVYSQGGTEHFAIKDGGNVGIGTATPARKLSIYEPSTSNVYLQLANSTSGAGNSQGFEIFYGGLNATFANRTTTGFIDFETSGSSTLKLFGDKSLQISGYGSGTHTGTTAYRLAVDASGNIIEEGLGAGAVDGAGATNQVTVWSDSDTVSGSGDFTWDGSTLSINGTLEASEKSFVIPHPTKENRKLVYGVLEGPEHAVYCRGKINSNVIELPEEWTGLVDEESITVQLTSIGKHQNLYVADIKDNKVFIKNGNLLGSSINAFYFIQGTRKDVKPLVTERDI